MERPARIVRPYLAIVSSVPRLYLAYRAWAWMEFIVQIIALTVFVFFWRAIYAGRSSLGGLTQAQTINYILLAQVMAPVVMESLVFTFGGLLRQGELAVELLRPMDLQALLRGAAIQFGALLGSEDPSGRDRLAALPGRPNPRLDPLGGHQSLQGLLGWHQP